MKLLLFKLLLQRRARDEGFTLPMVIALGLIMILLSAMNVLQSSEENLNAISQEVTADAKAMAEAGIIQYRQLLNRNRVLAIHNLSNWTNADVLAQTCDPISNVGNGWANNTLTDAWRNVDIDESDVGSDLNEDGDTSDTITIGSYKIVDYEYDNDGVLGDNDDNGVFDPRNDVNPDFPTDTSNDNDTDNDGESDARGILTVQGRGEGDSVAQIQVEIPLGVNVTDATGVTGDLENLIPALWVQDDSITIDNLTVDANNDGTADGNIIIRPTDSDDCNLQTTDGGNNIIRDTRTFVSFDDFMSDATNGRIELADAASQRNDLATPDFDNTIDKADRLLGRPSDLKYPSDPTQPSATACNNNFDCRYYYYSGSNVTITDTNLASDGFSKTIIYIDGNLTISGNVSIAPSWNFDSNDADGTLEADWITTITDADKQPPDDATSRLLEIHTTGNVTITGGGTVNIKALIYAGGTFNVNASTTVNINGSVWVKNKDDGTAWNNSGTVTIVPDDYKYYYLSHQRTPQPLTYAIEGWEIQEAQ